MCSLTCNTRLSTSSYEVAKLATKPIDGDYEGRHILWQLQGNVPGNQAHEYSATDQSYRCPLQYLSNK